MTLDPARMARAAREGFTQAADVADVLALEGGLDYRTAHKVVGRAVRSLVERGDPPAAITPALIADAAVQVTGAEVAIDASALAEALDPAADAAGRRQTGSSSPAAMAAMLGDCEATLAAARASSSEARAAAARAESALRERARALAGA
jgi:argininosuccinate lyase